MELKLWQKENRWSNYNLAKELGISECYISLIRCKKRKSSLQLKKAISRFTNNEVTVEELDFKEE